MWQGSRIEFFIAVCALLTSIAAIWLAWDQSRVMRAQQHGAVFPVLQVDGYVRNSPQSTAVGIEIRNSGVGPALIEAVEFFQDDETPYDFERERELLLQALICRGMVLSGEPSPPANLLNHSIWCGPPAA